MRRDHVQCWRPRDAVDRQPPMRVRPVWRQACRQVHRLLQWSLPYAPLPLGQLILHPRTIRHHAQIPDIPLVTTEALLPPPYSRTANYRNPALLSAPKVTMSGKSKNSSTNTPAAEAINTSCAGKATVLAQTPGYLLMLPSTSLHTTAGSRARMTLKILKGGGV